MTFWPHLSLGAITVRENGGDREEERENLYINIPESNRDYFSIQNKNMAV